MSAAKLPPRFLPTLTEVVHPLTPRVPEFDSDALVARLLQRVTPVMEEQLMVTLKSLMQEQLELMSSRMHIEVEAAVRKAVEQALAENHSPE